MGYAEKRGDYWRGRFKISPGRYGTVVDSNGAGVRFRSRRDAERAANDAEAKTRNGGRPVRADARLTFGEYVNAWFARQDLALSTMENYRRSIEGHLLPAFQDYPVATISLGDVALWEKKERALGYADRSLRLWRTLLHLILADAVDEGLRESNPAARRRGRGRRAGRSQKRGPEKVITDALGIVQLAERTALLSGRDDEFVAVVTLGFTGMRWGEMVGLETRYLRPDSVRVEWQLYELEAAMHRCPPKDDSRRTVFVPDWLSRLLTDHLTRTAPKPCSCHGHRYVFGGYGTANGLARRAGPRLSDVARLAGVSAGTVSNVLNRPDVVAAATRDTVREVIANLGFATGAPTGTAAPHYRRNGFATWLFQPAAMGRYPGKAPKPRPAGAAARRAVAGHPDPGKKRGSTVAGVLVAGRRRSDTTRPAALVQDIDGGARHAVDGDGRPDGPLRRLGASSLRARYRRHGAASARRADSGLGERVGDASAALPRLPGGRT